MAFLLQDVNRNRTWEQSREYAQPIPREKLFELNDTEPVDLGVVWYAKKDTASPRLDAIGLLSRNRLRLRFSQPIEYKPRTEIALTDSVSHSTIRAAYLFNDSQDRNVAFFHTYNELTENGQYLIDVTNLRGVNTMRALQHRSVFEGSSDTDTSTVRYLKQITEDGINPDEPLILQYTSLLGDTGISDSLKLIRNREVDTLSFRTEIWNNLLYVYPINSWKESDSYDFSTWNPHTQRFVNISHNLIKQADLGEINISVRDSSMVERLMQYFIYDNNGNAAASGVFRNETTVTNLKVGSYRAVVFPLLQEVDSSSAIWNSGSVYPFQRPSPLFVNPTVPVHSRMTADLVVTF
jgi:hypothetical protein